MDWSTVSLTLGVVFGISGAVGIFIANGKNKFAETQAGNYERTVKSYQVVIDGLEQKNRFLEGEIKELRVLHTANVKELGELKGELKMYSKLPLREIADNQRIITQVQLAIATHLGIDGFEEILDKLQAAHKS